MKQLFVAKIVGLIVLKLQDASCGDRILKQ